MGSINIHMDTTTADAWNGLRGYTDWTGDTAAKAAALVRAQDYIEATYRLRDELTAPEQSKLNSATYLLARDMLNGTTATIRASAPVVKESKEMSGMKKSVEYADAPSDPYPYITVLLSQLVVEIGSPGFAIGKLVR